MSKHTPGPWFSTGALPGYRHRISRTPNNLGWDLAHVCNGIDAEANAKLIAAAPELLEALQGVVAFWDRLNFDGSAINELHTAARAAIRKATE